MPGKQDPSYAYQRNFGKRLRACRLAAGYEGYQDFAKAVGLESETYRTYETGSRQPKLHVLAKIAEKLDKSLDFLILGQTPE